jgi:hypothetical protein
MYNKSERSEDFSELGDDVEFFCTQWKKKEGGDLKGSEQQQQQPPFFLIRLPQKNLK